ncbi:MAG: hypothetical protein U0937_03715, partial [Thermodesulfovibrionia bacterium]|nr:hypothetical protein [Thermodesulfovibrionia bacterium]
MISEKEFRRQVEESSRLAANGEVFKESLIDALHGSIGEIASLFSILGYSDREEAVEITTIGERLINDAKDE